MVSTACWCPLWVMASSRSNAWAKVARSVATSITSCWRLATRVRSRTAFSPSGAQGLDHTPVAIQRVVAEALELLKVCLPPHVRLEQALSSSNARVIGDPTQLHRVITNLCINAAHAMPKGGVLDVRLEPQRVAASCACSRGELSVGAYVCFTIRDSGTGIAPEILEQIFDPFFTTKAVGEGTGLGLWLVDEIVAEFDGAIDVSSTVGVGTTFKVWLPVAAESTRPVTSNMCDLSVTAGPHELKS